MNIKTILAVLAGMLLASCAKDIIEEGTLVKRNSSLTIEVTDEFAAATRADYSGFPSTSFETGDAIGIYAFDGSSYVASNIRFVRQSDGSWLPDEEIPYVEGNTYYAYFPYRATTYTPSTSGTVDAVDTRFNNFISDASNYFWQADQSTKANFTACNLMIAKGTITDTDDDAATVKFTMKHKRGLALIDGIANRWYYTDDAGTKNSPTLSFSGSSNSPYPMDGSYYFLTKPNVATSVAGNSVNIPAGKYQNIDATISGTPDYTYSLSTNNGSTFNSFNSTKPVWLTLAMNGTDFEVTTTTSGTKTVSLGTGNIRNVPGDATLKAATPVSNVDLSMVDNTGNARASRMTANCYLVHAAGSYKIPLVYGNAIKDGATNESAYYTSNTSNTLQRLVNHTNTGITDPWIKTVTGSSPDGAELVWEDVQGMISAVGIDGDFLTFTVSEDNIAEGNAVIAATLSGTIVWSWHIWVTNETLSNLTAINTGSYTYQVAPVNVGQVNGSFKFGATIYAGEQCKVHATANGVTMEFLVRAKNPTSGGTERFYPCPCYQWGRKDAMYPGTGAFDSAGTLISTYSGTTLVTSTSATPGATIQHPNYWYYNGSNYGPYGTSSTYARKYNYWDINNTTTANVTTSTKKTVYDPCPPGFCVPTGNLYYWMGNTSSRSDANWNSHTQIKTWVTATYSANTSGPDLVFPASGCRSFDNGKVEIGGLGYCWSSTPGSTDNGCNLQFNSNNWYWRYYNPRSYGYPVRPVVEE